MQTRSSSYSLPVDTSAEVLLEELETWPDLHGRATRRIVRTHYDSFDWRVFRAGGELAVETAPHRPRQLVWQGGSTPISCRLPGRKRPGFADDLPEGGLKDRLGKILAMRRLLPVAEVALRVTELRTLDKRRKTVARLFLHEAEVAEPGSSMSRALAARLELTEVRGYVEAFDEVAARLQGLGLAETGSSLFLEALEALGKKAGSYTGKIATVLRPEQEAGEALRLILGDLLTTIELNEEGTRQDLDSEFLHDFRVAVRRTRAALSQLGHLLPAEPLARFKDEFRWLGGLTGPTRDLDVYLLKLPDYETSLPAHVGKALAPLRSFLARHQKAEQRKLARSLRTTRYRELLAAWRAFLGESFAAAPATASRPILALAGQRIWKVARKVLKRGELAIRHKSPAADLHRLRIDCKKLRYLMEFFRSLFPRDELDPLIRSLKVLQNNLGDFNDYHVQQRSLQLFAEQWLAEGDAEAPALLAMGRLVARLEHGQEEERRRFQKCFESFSTPENRELMERLFGEGPAEA